MRRPNKSGSVIKLSGKRRRPYAVRIYKGMEEVNGRAVNKYEYLAYFEKSSEALQFLEKYNQAPVEVVKQKDKEKKHRFSEIYDMWTDELSRRAKPLSSQSLYAYQAAYNNLKPLHNTVFENLRLEDIEEVALQHSNKSLSTITNIKIVLKGMYKTAMRHRYVSEDISQLIILEHKDENARPHAPFTPEEIEILWANKDDYMTRIILILIYTGLRIRELLFCPSKDVFIKDKYFITGSKTSAGISRKIPISNKIMPFFDVSNEYLITYKGKKLSYDKACQMLNRTMKAYNMSHTFHDTRHTCSTLLEKAAIPELHRKLILGHKSSDITDRYTHVSIEQLIADINKI